MTPEGKVLSAITTFLRAEMEEDKCYFERRQAVGIGYRKGVPDLWFTKHGKHYEVELKRPGGERSTMQIKWAKRLIRTGAYYALIDSFDDFLELYEKA